MLTARDDIADKLAGFEHGADDYVTKPFVLVEVEAIRALLARAGGRVATPLRRFDRLVIDGGRHGVRVDDRPVRLTPKGWSILEALLPSWPQFRRIANSDRPI